MSEKFEDVIDPEQNVEALAEAQGKGIEEEITILQLLVKNSVGDPIKVKVRYLPQSIGSELEYENGKPTPPTTPPGTRRPKFNFRTWAKNNLSQLNDLALKNIQIVNDLDGSVTLGPKDIKLSLIASAEFRRLYGLCFPGASIDSEDSENENNVSGRPKRKGIRGGQSDPVSS
jgi:hypothetical protein